MNRVRRSPPVVEDEQKRVRRVRTHVDETEPDEELEVEDSPDTAVEGETEQEAGDRIEAKYRARAKSPLKAIRAFCVICMGCYPREVAKCTARQCVLYPFRFGRNPFQKRGPK
jgi:hypothetical protein